MPGKLLLTDALQLVTTRPDLLPWLVIGLSDLGALLMFGFVRDLFDSRRVALFAAALYLFLPARTFFDPLMNTVTPVFVIGCAWLLLRWLQTGRTLHAALLGVALYALVLFEPLPLVMGLLFLALALAAILRREITGDRFVAQAAVTVFALIGTSEAMSAWVDFDIVRTIHIVGRHAMEFNQTTGRPYGAWIIANLWEFAFGVGFCQFVLFVVAVMAGRVPPRRRRKRLAQRFRRLEKPPAKNPDPPCSGSGGDRNDDHTAAFSTPESTQPILLCGCRRVSCPGFFSDGGALLRHRPGGLRLALEPRSPVFLLQGQGRDPRRDRRRKKASRPRAKRAGSS